MSATGSPAAQSTGLPAGRALTAGVIAAIGSAASAIAVASVAKALGVHHASQLKAGPLAFLSVTGVAVGTIAWVTVCRSVSRPAVVLRRLVPTVLVLSLIPDVIVGLGADTWGDSVSLALAHLAVFTVTVPALAWRLPPSSLSRSASRQDLTSHAHRA